MSVRWLADENIPLNLVRELRRLGEDVASVAEISPGLGDPAVLTWAISDSRVLLTFDKDFGALSRNALMPEDCGVVLIRLPMSPDESGTRRLAALLRARSDWAGFFSILEPGRVRMRPFGESS